MSDKGGVVVVMDREQYISLCDNLLRDNTYYSPIQRDPACTLEQKANKLISKLKNSNKINEELAHKLMMYGSVLARFYALPKIHKPVLSLRPIVSSIDAPNSKLEKFLASILTLAYDTDNPFYIQDSFTFSEFINDFKLPENHILISLDVVSLFTNLPLELARQSIINHWTSISPHSPIDLNTFLEILDYIFDSTYFVFNDRFFKQIHGTPMGASISPIIANYVMDDLVTQSLSILSFHPPFIKKYVDDLILAIPQDKSEETLFIFNLANQSLQFTMEREVNGSIPFLDMQLIRNPDNTIFTKWYRKPISSGRYMNYFSDHPTKMKIGLVSALATRVSRLTHHSFRNEALQSLKSLLEENSYPKSFLQRIIFQRNTTNVSLTDIHNQFRTQTPPPDNSVQTQTIFRSLPYINGLTPKLINIFKGQNIKFSTRIINTIKPLFSKLKQPVPILQQSGLIYKIPCQDCNMSYIGQTSRSLKGRITSHKSDCRRNIPSCALSIHANNYDHTINFNSPEIIFSENHYHKRIFLEMVAIHNSENTMNVRSDVDDLSSIYSYILQLSNN